MLYNKALLSRSLNTHTYTHTHTPYTIYTRSIFFNSLNISGRMSVCMYVHDNEGFPLMKFIATIGDKMLF
jgi:hypothetical protein